MNNESKFVFVRACVHVRMCVCAYAYVRVRMCVCAGVHLRRRACVRACAYARSIARHLITVRAKIHTDKGQIQK